MAVLSTMAMLYVLAVVHGVAAATPHEALARFENAHRISVVAEPQGVLRDKVEKIPCLSMIYASCGSQGLGTKFAGLGTTTVVKETFSQSLEPLGLCGHLVKFGQSSGAVPPFDVSSLARKPVLADRDGQGQWRGAVMVSRGSVQEAATGTNGRWL